MTLQEQFNKIADKYIKAFCKKQDLELDFWVADIIGDTAFFADLCFSYDNIRLDVDNDIPKGEIIRWYYDTLTAHFNKDITVENLNLSTMTYRNWLINEGLLKKK